MINWDDDEIVTCDLSDNSNKKSDIYYKNQQSFESVLSGITLTEKETRTLAWLCNYEPETVERICNIINKVKFSETSNRGRKKKVDPDRIKAYKNKGKTQEWIAGKLKVSLSTVKRYWK